MGAKGGISVNIKEAETMSGVSRRNIRFYEDKGLIQPRRNRENDYREYTPEDIARLKQIRMLRQVDMPLETIREILTEQCSLETAAAEQRKVLELQKQRLDTAIRFCEEFQQLGAPDVDAVLRRMEEPKAKAGLFQTWAEDYRRFAKAQGQKVFTFVPDNAITTPAEFTLALCRYGTDNDLNLVITREGMYPEFTLNGIEYAAERIYTAVGRVPTAVIRCEAKHPEALEPPQPKWKRALLAAAHYGWVVPLLMLMNFDLFFGMNWSEVLGTWEGWMLLAALLILVAVDLYRFWLFHYNERGL